MNGYNAGFGWDDDGADRWSFVPACGYIISSANTGESVDEDDMLSLEYGYDLAIYEIVAVEKKVYK